MKKKVLALLMVMLVLAFAGCGNGAKGGKLKVGLNSGYPPFEYFDEDGTTLIGVDIEIAKAIAEEIGMEVEFVDTAWEGIFAGLSKGDYDCIISAVTITPERLLDFAFSTPYIQNWQCIVTLSDAKVKPASLDELAGLKVCYQESTASDDVVTEYFANKSAKPDVYEYAQVMNCFNDLALGRVDAVVCDSTVASAYIGDGIYTITWNQEDVEGEVAEEFGVCMNENNTELLEKVNKALATLKSNGKLDEILNKYFR